MGNVATSVRTPQRQDRVWARRSRSTAVTSRKCTVAMVMSWQHNINVHCDVTRGHCHGSCDQHCSLVRNIKWNPYFSVSAWLASSVAILKLGTRPDRMMLSKKSEIHRHIEIIQCAVIYDWVVLSQHDSWNLSWNNEIYIPLMSTCDVTAYGAH